MSLAQQHDLEKILDGLWRTLGPPELTDAEAIRVVKKLWRHFAGGSAGTVFVSRGKRYGVYRDHDGCFHVNSKLGWRRIVENLAFYFVNDRGWTDYDYANYQRKMLHYIMDHGWLGGKLKDKPKPVRDPVVKRAALVTKSIARWEAKRDRANRALRKLRVKQRYYEKKGVA